VPDVWKREKLIFEILKPWGLLREEHLTVLELCGLYLHHTESASSASAGMARLWPLLRAQVKRQLGRP